MIGGLQLIKKTPARGARCSKRAYVASRPQRMPPQTYVDGIVFRLRLSGKAALQRHHLAVLSVRFGRDNPRKSKEIQ